jgi:hypothetical protein
MYTEIRHPDSGCRMDGFTWWMPTEDVTDALGQGGLYRMARDAMCALCDMVPAVVGHHATLPPRAVP